MPIALASAPYLLGMPANALHCAAGRYGVTTVMLLAPTPPDVSGAKSYVTPLSTIPTRLSTCMPTYEWTDLSAQSAQAMQAHIDNCAETAVARQAVADMQATQLLFTAWCLFVVILALIEENEF